MQRARRGKSVVSYRETDGTTASEFKYPPGCIVKAIWVDKVINKEGERHAYPAYVVGWNLDGTYAVSFDDGCFLDKVPETHMTLCKKLGPKTFDLTFSKCANVFVFFMYD